jgi:3-oxoacyl-[acyl-carrier-protein] synthase-3
MSEASGVGIRGIGLYLPPTVRGNDFWDRAPNADEQRRQNILAVEKTTSGAPNPVAPEIALAMAALGNDPFRGARQRHVIDDSAEPSDMEAEAARRAMRAAGVRPDEIDVVMVASLVPDRLHPSNGPAVQHKCGLERAVAWSLDLGCASFQPQLIAAHALLRAGTYRNILCVYSSAVSRVLDYSMGWSPAFGDGAAAVVLGALPSGYGLLGHWCRTDGALREGVVYCPVVDGEPRPRWDRHAAPIRLVSLDPDLGKGAGLRSTAFCQEACSGALASAGLAIDDIDFFVANQSVAWLVDACRRSVGLRAEQTIDTFQEVANIGAAAIVLNLERAWRTGRIQDGDHLLIYSPGAGLTRAAVVYRWRAPVA